MFKRITICTGGSLGDWALPYLKQSDYLIGADRGAYFLASRGFRMDAALGDFDSVTAEQLDLIRTSSSSMSSFDPIEKDYTDTELAFRHALSLQPELIVMLGAIGSRFDHSLANVHLLNLALRQGVDACIIDPNNRISLTEKRLTVAKSEFNHVSLLPLTPEVTGVTLTGFQYPLHQATLHIGQSVGISNVLVAEQGLVEIEQGLLLVMESRD